MNAPVQVIVVLPEAPDAESNQRGSDSTCWLRGGQQGMPQPNSQDLRNHVIDAVERGEMSRRAAARRYKISESVAVNLLEWVKRDGSRRGVRRMRPERPNGRVA